ncbi:chemotaxis protein CheA [Candidatus Woesearchaeota archaeon]|nr:chemotaxis protein CheA [Candidatus Woesearchaeota archaeon]
MSKYKEEFMNEVRDHLDSLNESLLVLEKEPENEETINKIFRSFHTLKGNSAAMGYLKYSELAHKLEDVLDKIKNKELNANTEILDLLFEGCDILDEGLESIESKGTDDIEIDSLVSRIKEFLNEDTNVKKTMITENAFLSNDETKEMEWQVSQGMKTYRVIVIFDKNNLIKHVKAQLVLTLLSRFYRVIKTTPGIADFTPEKFGDELELIICTYDTDSQIRQKLGHLSGIRKVEFMGLNDKYVREPEQTGSDSADGMDSHSKKEAEKHAIANKHHMDMRTQIRSVKIDIRRLDKLMNMVGELLINKMRLQQIARQQNIPEFNKVMKLVDRLTDDIQNEVTKARMVPIGNIFNRFPRMVRDLSNKENKKINFSIEGGDIEFDRTILDELGEPLVHLLRNSVDHGIELPSERINSGKPETGIIKITATREKNHAFIIVEDDGAGIDSKKVREACIRKGALTRERAEAMTDEEIKMLVFKSGVSTSEKVTDVSGRGVGMDVVQTKINSMGGSVKLESDVSKGTKVIIRLPLTVSIVTCLLIQIQELICAIPLTNVIKTLSLAKEEIKSIKRYPVINYMGKEIALIDLRSLFGYNVKDGQKITVVVVDKGNEMVGLIVDRIISQEEILIKRLDKNIKNARGIAGNTILGDGTVGLILDVNSLVS